MLTDIRKISPESLIDHFTDLGEPKYRAQQVSSWLWEKSASSFDEMTNLPLPLRNKMKENFVINKVKTDIEQFSSDGTIKVRFDLFDGKKIEGVLIPTEKRITACISSQVGCTLQCSFCATGLLKRERNLDPGEIFDQASILRSYSLKHFQKPLSNIVFMGMGEPLLNADNVLEGIDRITKGMEMSPKRITLSTVGISRGIMKIADLGVKFNLALSLHAAIDEKREKIMPINKSNNISSLIDALSYFYKMTGNKITYEYILFKDVNDSEEDARALIALSRKVPSFINIIEYNPVAGLDFEKTEEEKRKRFVKILEDAGITAKVRLSRGKDINAACGQLANV